MKRKAPARSSITVLPPLTATEADANKQSNSTVASLPFWQELNADERLQLSEQTRFLMVAYLQLDLTPIEIGQRLLRVKTLLSPHRGAFAEYLKRTRRFAGRSAYRYMEDYEKLREYFSEAILEAMIRQGFKITAATRKRPLGVWTDAYKALKMNSEEPPKTGDPAATARYLSKLEQTHQQLKADQRALEVVKARAEEDSPGNPEFEKFKNSLDTLSRQAFQMFKNSLRKLEGKDRERFLEVVMGAVLTERGVSHMTFEACAIPVDWKRGPGRPRSEDRLGMDLTEDPLPLIASNDSNAY